LEKLVCEGATQVTSIEFLGRGTEQHHQINQLTNLRCTNFSSMLMLQTTTNHTLRYLNISNCPKITAEGVKNLLHQLPSLEVLNVE
jgi:Leucine Rich repeat